MTSALRTCATLCVTGLLAASIPAPVLGQATVAPDAAASGSILASTSGQTADFTVSGEGYAFLECWGTGGITCQVAAGVSLNGPTNVRVSFSTSERLGDGYLFLRSTQYESAQCDDCPRHVDIGSRAYTIEQPSDS